MSIAMAYNLLGALLTQAPASAEEQAAGALLLQQLLAAASSPVIEAECSCDEQEECLACQQHYADEMYIRNKN